MRDRRLPRPRSGAGWGAEPGGVPRSALTRRRPLLEDRSLALARDPALLEGVEGAVRPQLLERLVDAVPERIPFLEDYAEVLLLSSRRKLPDDDTVIHLDGDDDEPGGHVRHDPVDLAVLEGLDGVVDRVEHRRVFLRLDLLLDHGEAGGADRRTQLERLEVRDRGGPGDRRAGHGDQTLAHVIVGVAEVDGSIALGRERDLVDEEVEVLWTRLERLSERDLHPFELVGGEPQALGDRVGHRALVPLPGRGVVELPRRSLRGSSPEPRGERGVVRADRESPRREEVQVLDGALVRRR